MTDNNETTALVPMPITSVITVDVRQIATGGDVSIKTYDSREIKVCIGDVKKLVKGGQKCSDLELAAYLAYCVGNGYDPLRNQCYLIKYKDTEPAEWVVSYHVYLDRANRHPMFDGQEMGIVWRVEGEKSLGQPCDFEPDDKHVIVGSWARVLRKDRALPFYREVPLGEMIKMRYDRDTRKQVPRSTWANMLTTMAVKVPLCRALRDAFPDELGGSYADVERIGPPTVSDASANVLPRDERPTRPDLPPDETEPQPSSTATAILAQRVKDQIGKQRPGVEVTRDMQTSILLTLASSVSDGEPESAFEDGARWTDELVEDINHALDTSGPFPENWLPAEAEPPEEGGDDA